MKRILRADSIAKLNRDISPEELHRHADWLSWAHRMSYSPILQAAARLLTEAVKEAERGDGTLRVERVTQQEALRRMEEDGQ